MTTIQEEIQIRWARARQEMEKSGLDALIITEKYNYWYFTGHLSREFDKKMRPMVLILPRTGPAIGVVYRQAAPVLQKTTGPIETATYEDVPFPPALLVETLENAGLANARLGMELGEFERLGLSDGQMAALKTGLPKASFIDASDVLAACRLEKTPYEIDQIRQACSLSLAAWNKAVAQLEAGMTGKDFARILAAEFAHQGIDYNVPGHITVEPADKPLAAGDVLWCDFGGSWNGYQADLARRVSIGPPTADQAGYQEQITAIIETEIAAIKPGKRACDVAKTVSDALVAAGHPALGERKRVGHGLGLAPSEAPSLSLADDTILKPGMVLTPEPRFNAPTGRVHIEEVVVVTETGCERLTEGASTLYVSGTPAPKSAGGTPR